MSDSIAIFQISFLFLNIMLVLAGLAATQVVNECPDRLLRWVSRYRRLSAPLLAVLLLMGWSAASAIDGGTFMAGLTFGIAPSLAAWRLIEKAHRRWMTRERHLSAAQPTLPSRNAHGTPWPQPVSFVPQFASSRELDPESRHRQERGDRTARRVRRDLLALAAASYLTSLLWTTTLHRPAPLAYFICLASLLTLLPLAGLRKWRDRRWRSTTGRTQGAARSIEAVATAHSWEVFKPGHPGVGNRWLAAPLMPERTPRLVVPLTLVGRIGSWELIAVEQRSPSQHVSGRPLVRYAYLLWLPGLALPKVELAGREDALAVGQRSLALELEEFNRRFTVQTLDDRFAHMFLHPRVIEHLMRTFPDGCHLTVADDAIMLTGMGGLTPSRVEDHVACLIGTASLIPSHLVRDFGIEGRLTVR